MKKIFSALIVFILIYSFVSCGTAYEPVKSTDEEKRIVMTAEIKRKKCWETSYGQMNEEPTWSKNNKDGEPNWCEAFMWERAKNSGMPMMLEYKYFNNKENDEEVERRLEYERD